MVPHLVRQRRRPVELLDHVELAAGERNGRLDAVVALRAGGLHAAAAPRAVRTHVLDIDRRGDDLNIREGELRALCDDTPVERDHRAAIIVQPVAVAALLVRVEVHAAQLQTHTPTAHWTIILEERKVDGKRYLESSLFDELDAHVELPEFVVAPTRIGEDLDAVEAHEDVRATDAKE